MYILSLHGCRFLRRRRNAMNDDRTRQIEHRARTEKRTKDRDYNEGAKLIRERGYEAVKDAVDVIYWCKCNGYC